MSSSSSSTAEPEILKSLLLAMKESSEKETRNTNLTLGSPQEAISERRVEIPSFRSASVRRGSEIMKFYPPKSNKIYSFHLCKKGFSTLNDLGCHQNAHKQEREWDNKRKEMEADFPGPAFLNPYLDKPHILLGGYSIDALSNENHLGITLEPFKRQVYPSFNSGVTGGNAGMNMAVVPRLTPTCFFTGNSSTNDSASKAPGAPGPFPFNNNMYPLIHRNIFPFPPPRTSRDLVPQGNVLSEENLISKVGMNNAVEIDDDEDQPEEGTYQSGGNDLSLSL